MARDSSRGNLFKSPSVSPARCSIPETPEGGRVQVFGQDGTFLAGWGEEGQFPAGIVVDKDGDLYVTDYLANTLSKYRLLPPLVPEATPTV